MSALYVLLKKVLHLLYPTRCPVCGDYIGYEEGFCKLCESRFTAYKGKFRIKNADCFFAVYEYNDSISPAVILMKNGTSGNAPYAFAKSVFGIVKDIKADLIIPVPMFIKDKRKRGYNQTELISRELSIMTGIPYDNSLVIKNRKTKAQKELGKKERMINLRDAFSVSDSSAIAGRRIILLDDVCTTGSTLSEISALLKTNGAEAVFCVSCCKTV